LAVVCTEAIAIVSTTGIPAISFAGNADYNFRRLGGLADFIDHSSHYAYYKLNKVEVNLVRSVDETSMFTNTKGCNVLLTYYPDLTSASVPYAITSRDQTSYRIDLMTFEEQKIMCPMINIEYTSSSGAFTMNNTKWQSISRVSDLDGELVISDNNTVVVPAGTKLFSMEIKYFVEFARLM